MATKTITSITDDIDGTDGAETVLFSYDGKSYSIDLADKNKKAFEKALEPYFKAARSTVARRVSTASTSSNKEELASIRTWAKENGLAISDRGRVSAEIREAFAAANK